ncbi:hypothetical protein N9E09_00095 [bacterium]|jgi:hypothetical protein|nr:hypothetical protein [bacterium]
MKWFHIENKQKWGISEIQHFINEETNTGLRIDTNWKWGSFDIGHHTHIEETSEPTNVYMKFDEPMVNALDSGTDELIFYNLKTGEEYDARDYQEFINNYYDEGINYLFDNGFDDGEDSEFWIEGGFTIEETECPYEF